MELYFLYLLLLKVVEELTAETCVTPNQEKANCISLYKCPTLVRALKTQKQTAINFVRQSHCGNWSSEFDPKVCCGTASTFINVTKKTALNETVPTKQPLSDKQYCGYQHTDDYFYTGNDTSIDEFPWLAVFIYKYDDDLDEAFSKYEFVQYGCAGSVINARYVLTAAQCLRLRTSSAVAVRLGEYNIKNDKDCIKFTDLDDCSNPVEDISFEEKIIHPGYNRRLGIHDIALIRLNKTVVFTDYIRPICLPIPGTAFAQPGEKLTTTGFGKIIENGNYTVIKKRIYTQLITTEECKLFFNQIPGRTRNVTEDMICAEDFYNNTIFSCEGDSGAPVMISRRTQWHMEGLLVWATDSCGTPFPQVYVKVANYLNWIEKNIKPWRFNMDPLNPE